MKAGGPGVPARLAAASIPDLRVPIDPIPRRELEARLPVGSTQTARVLESAGQGQYIVGIAGFRLAAESALELPPGARVRVEVAAHEPRVQLRIVRPDASGLEEALRRLGFEKAPPEQRAAVTTVLGELMEQGLPLTRETVRRAQDGIARGLSPRSAVAMVRHEIPLAPATLARAKAADGSVARALESLTSSLAALGRETEAAVIRDALTFRGDLGALFESHPLKLERRLLAGDVRPERPEVKPILEAIARPPDQPSPAERDAAAAARQLLETLEGRYLVGTPEREIPFVVDDDGTRDAAITAERTGGHTHVAVRLDTSRLGAVVGLVDSVQRGVGIALGVESPEARQALLAAAPELVERLRALGFRLDGMTVDVLDRSRGASPTPRPALGLDLKA